MNDLLEDLNEDQRSAIFHDGSVLLIACPGSGKTRTLVHRVARELGEIASHREFVIALTYTHVAADEVRERIEAEGIDTSQLWVGTIHSFCLEWIIRPYSIYSSALREGVAVLDIYEQEQRLDTAAKVAGLKNKFDCQHFASEDGFIVDRSITGTSRSKAEIAIAKYRSDLRAENLMDFEMMLSYALDLIRSHKPIATRLSQIMRLIAVDEYQDTNEVQYQILSSIFSASNSKTMLFMVGDPNQGIFRSLGGVAKTRRQLEKLMNRSISELDLTKNYRSSKQIIGFYKNFEVLQMKTESAGPYKDHYGHLTYRRDLSFDDISNYLISSIRYHVKTTGIDSSEICIVAPRWRQLASLTRKLAYEMPEFDFNGPGLTPFGQDRDNFWFKVARIALTSASSDRFATRIHWAKEILEILQRQGLIPDELRPLQLLKISNGIKIATDDGVDYLEWYFEAFTHQLGLYLREGDEIFQQRVKFFERMNARISEVWAKERIPIRSIEVFRRSFQVRSGITISTIHGIKGEEYDVVFAFGLTEDYVPHFAEIKFDKIEANDSAKRSLYVIGSRARKHLHLISERNGKPPTQVLNAIQYAYTRSR